METGKLLKERGWKRYLLVTSAVHMPRSMLAFSAAAPEPVAAPGDFTLRAERLSPLDFAPSVGAARAIALTLHEYIGLINYYWRVRFSELVELTVHASPLASFQSASSLRGRDAQQPQERTTLC